MENTSIADEEDAFLSDIFAALSHSTRQGILRLLGENEALSFSELMEKLDVKDSSTLTHHLKRMEGLVGRVDNGKYRLLDLGQMAYRILRRGDFYVKMSYSEVQKELHERSLRNPLITFPLILVATLILTIPLTFSVFLAPLVWRIGFVIAGCYLVYWGLIHILPEFGFSKQLAFYITCILFGLIWLTYLISAL